eukprot:gnl/TRDRNA2_/TRDRNA2_177466_c0_seq1.p1 gnl/TRDRNA2_/TRDRNA2_177466_c0~~gnl/TRDRNA2_/TRDRNA2_177466_c0_seq1.p1  ORF type:complete len:396 (-),score=74.17 gnl/TRDRNA2_/TRDRNA2_177466_c0_seq1:62-1249(-)
MALIALHDAIHFYERSKRWILNETLYPSFPDASFDMIRENADNSKLLVGLFSHMHTWQRFCGEEDSNNTGCLLDPERQETLLGLIFNILRQHPDDDALAASGLKLMHRVIYENKGSVRSQNYCLKNGGDTVTVSAMQRHMDKPEIQVQGCHILYDLVAGISCMHGSIGGEKEGQVVAFWEKDRIELLQQSVLETDAHYVVAAALRTHVKNEAVLKAAANAALALCSNNNGCAQARFANAGGVEALVTVLKSHPGVRAVESSTLAALLAVAIPYKQGFPLPDECEIRKRMVRAGLVDLLISILSRYPDDGQMALKSCDLLRSLAEADEDAVKIMVDGGVVNSVAAMQSNLRVQFKPFQSAAHLLGILVCASEDAKECYEKAKKIDPRVEALPMIRT